MIDLLSDQESRSAIDGLAGDVRKWADRRAAAERRFVNALLLAIAFAAGVAFILGMAVGGAQ